MMIIALRKPTADVNGTIETIERIVRARTHVPIATAHNLEPEEDA